MEKRERGINVEEIIFVTTNKGKIQSAQDELIGIKVLPFHADIVELRSDDIKDIAKQKVTEGFKLTKKPCIAMDTGFYIDAWNGFPKAFVNNALETLGLQGIMKLMDGVENRKCQFKECVAYYDGESYTFFESSEESSIASEIRGEDQKGKWSDLWYIVVPNGYEKTMAEFTQEDFEKYNKSLDNTSLKQFGRWFNSR